MANNHTLFGTIAVSAGYISEQQLIECLEDKNELEKGTGADFMIGEIIQNKGYIDGKTIAKILAIQKSLEEGNIIDVAEISCEIQEESLFPEIPGYTIECQIGHSKDTIVYKAFQETANREVTIEMFYGVRESDNEFKDRLRKEANTATSLYHPAVKSIYSIGKYGEYPYIVTEYVDAESLYNVLRREEKVPLLGAIEIIIQIVDGLNAAQERGLIHGDLKPSVILFGKDGIIKISRLGIAKRTRKNLFSVDDTGSFIPSYVAPEILVGKADPDVRSDIYSVGAIFHHLLTGKPPYNATTFREILTEMPLGLSIHLPVDETDCREQLQNLLQGMLMVNAGQRLYEYGAILDELNDVRLKVLRKAKGPSLSHTTKIKLVDSPRKSIRSRPSAQQSKLRVDDINADKKKNTTPIKKQKPKQSNTLSAQRYLQRQKNQSDLEIDMGKGIKKVVAFGFLMLLVIAVAGIWGYLFVTNRLHLNRDSDVEQSSDDNSNSQNQAITVEGHVAELVASVQNKPDLYYIVKDELNLLGQREESPSIAQALDTINAIYRAKIKPVFEATKAEIAFYIEKDDFKTAALVGKKYIEQHPGMEEAGAVQRIMDRFPDLMSKRYKFLEKEILTHIKQEDYESAMEIIDLIRNKFESELLISKVDVHHDKIEKRKKAVAEELQKESQVILDFTSLDHMNYLNEKNGVWEIEDQILKGHKEKDSPLSAQIYVKQPYYLSGKIKIDDKETYASIALGSCKLSLDNSKGLVTFSSSVSPSIKRKKEFAEGKWYYFEARIDLYYKEVYFLIDSVTFKGKCDFLANNIRVACLEGESISFDDLKIRAKDPDLGAHKIGE